MAATKIMVLILLFGYQICKHLPKPFCLFDLLIGFYSFQWFVVEFSIFFTNKIVVMFGMTYEYDSIPLPSDVEWLPPRRVGVRCTKGLIYVLCVLNQLGYYLLCYMFCNLGLSVA